MRAHDAHDGRHVTALASGGQLGNGHIRRHGGGGRSHVIGRHCAGAKPAAARGCGGGATGGASAAAGACDSSQCALRQPVAAKAARCGRTASALARPRASCCAGVAARGVARRGRRHTRLRHRNAQGAVSGTGEAHALRAMRWASCAPRVRTRQESACRWRGSPARREGVRGQAQRAASPENPPSAAKSALPPGGLAAQNCKTVALWQANCCARCSRHRDALRRCHEPNQGCGSGK